MTYEIIKIICIWLLILLLINMIYVDGSPELLDLIKIWTPPTLWIEIWSNSDTVLQKLRANITCILIYPWHYIRKNPDGNLTSESNEFIHWVTRWVHDGICTIFWWNGELLVFWEKSIITDTPSRKKYLDILNSTKKKD